MEKVQFYNRRTKKWCIAKEKRNGMLRIIRCQDKKARGIRVLKKRRRQKK